MKKSVLGVLSAMALLAGCQTITEAPTKPTKNPGSGLTIPVPFFPRTGATPSPSPTPRPSPVPSPSAPTPTPTPTPGYTGCGNPLPGPIGRVDAKVHIRGPNQITLDSTPLVGPDAAYCAQVGFTDGRRFCAVRPEGHPERFACFAVS